MMAETKTLQLEDDEWMDWETRHPHVPMWKHMIAGKLNTPCSNYSHDLRLGSCAGIVEHCAMFPFDTVKVSTEFFLSINLVRRICKPVGESWESETW